MTQPARSASFNFSGSVILVTGGGTGIGRGIATAFLDAGASVVVTGRREAPLLGVVSDYPERAVSMPCDIGDSAEVAVLISTIIERYGRLDVVVSNAAGFAVGPVTELSDERWARLRAANLDGFFFLARATLPHLVESAGSLIAVSSLSGIRGDWGQPGYAATKAGVNNFVRSLALDYGDRGVRVNAIAPSFTHTELTDSIVGDAAALAPFMSRVPMGRPAVPDEMAQVVLFLASEAARYITGVVIPVDGGTSASNGQARIQ